MKYMVKFMVRLTRMNKNIIMQSRKLREFLKFWMIGLKWGHFLLGILWPLLMLFMLLIFKLFSRLCSLMMSGKSIPIFVDGFISWETCSHLHITWVKCIYVKMHSRLTSKPKQIRKNRPKSQIKTKNKRSKRNKTSLRKFSKNHKKQKKLKK